MEMRFAIEIYSSLTITQFISMMLRQQFNEIIVDYVEKAQNGLVYTQQSKLLRASKDVTTSKRR